MLRSVFKTMTAAAFAAAGFALATPASAAWPACDVNLTNPNASACVGYYSGNLLGGELDKRNAQKDAIFLLTGDPTIFDGSLDQWNYLDANWKIEEEGGDTPFDFGMKLYGDVVLGAHWGNVYGAPQGGGQGNVTAFYLFHFGDTGGYIALDDGKTRGWSNAVLYTHGTPGNQVPEPATWAMMLVGFGAAGAALRRSRRKTALLTQIA